MHFKHNFYYFFFYGFPYCPVGPVAHILGGVTVVSRAEARGWRATPCPGAGPHLNTDTLVTRLQPPSQGGTRHVMAGTSVKRLSNLISTYL